MAADSGSSFPFTAVSVVILFLTTTYLGQRAFDLWRQTDPATGKELRLSEPPVEARLWEDPLEALGRHRQKLKEVCRKDGDSGVANAPFCLMGQPIEAENFSALFKDKDTVTLVAAVVPGAALVGAEEVRRRTRFAILAGLNAAGYVPDVSERMGLLTIQRCEYFTGCNSEVSTSPPSTGERKVAAKPEANGSSPSLAANKDLPTASPTDVVFETLRAKNDERRGMAVLWIDDTTIGQRWLSATAIMLRQLTADDAKFELRILGPAASDTLAKALGRDLDLLQQEAFEVQRDAIDRRQTVQKTSQKSNEFKKNWATLARLKLISPQSTAPAREVRIAAGMPVPCEEKGKDGKRTDCVDKAFTDRLQGIGRIANVDAPKGPFFIRTIGTDDVLVKRLVDELKGRGIDPCGSAMPGKRIVLIGEWDSIYARTFGKTLESALQCNESQTELQTYSYLRGLDGATLEGTTSQTRRAGEGSRDSKTAPIEWPEGRGQADYVRRLVEGLLTDNDKKSVQAVGVIGWDVHDKLILLQALRDAFPDRVLFTTDIDARLAHPSVSRYTRNVIVASSLPLTVEPWPPASAVASPRPAIARFGQFRDSYQTAAFLAARVAVETMKPDAVCTDLKNPKNLECNIEKAVTMPSLFEIGREGMVELPLAGVADDEKINRRVFAGIAFAVLAGAAMMILFGYRAPAMREIFEERSKGDSAAFNPGHVALAVLQVVALGYAAGIVAELAFPGSIGACGVATFAVVAGLLFYAFVFPGTRRIAALVLGALVVGAGWWLIPSTANDMREPFAPLSGVSAWPSELLRILAIVLFAWFLDEAWCRSANAVASIRETYRLDRLHDAAQPARSLGARLREISVWFWKPDVVTSGSPRCVDGAGLWREYGALLGGPARFVRVAAWLALSALLISGLYFVVNTLSDHAWPEIPARGASDQRLFSWTLALSSAAVLTLMVVVGDVTILTWRFVDVLRIGRTVYPRDTIKLFAAKLGPEVEAQAGNLVAPDPDQREAARRTQTKCDNSLLDDWIDAKLLAEHTAEIGRLIVYPFILVALLVVARSRLFDNWDIGGAVLILLVLYMLWSIAMAALLNLSAERARRKALDGMADDELWLEGAGAKFSFDKLAKSFSRMTDEVKTLRKGAFAPFFEQPLVQAILVPLGGAGGVQLLDWLLYARAQ